MDGFLLIAFALFMLASGIALIGLLGLAIGIRLKRPGWIRNGATVVLASIALALLIVGVCWVRYYFSRRPSEAELWGIYQRSQGERAIDRIHAPKYL